MHGQSHLVEVFGLEFHEESTRCGALTCGRANFLQICGAIRMTMVTLMSRQGGEQASKACSFQLLFLMSVICLPTSTVNESLRLGERIIKRLYLLLAVEGVLPVSWPINLPNVAPKVVINKYRYLVKETCRCIRSNKALNAVEHRKQQASKSVDTWRYAHTSTHPLVVRVEIARRIYIWRYSE